MMKHLWLVAPAFLVLLFAYARTHPSQPWDFHPPALPVGQDELLYLNQV
ncbi:hypothetical protein P12x_005292 [Tundrisphaera lichenicola]